MSLTVSSLLYRNLKTWAPVNLDRLQHWIDQGRITSSPEQPITARELVLSKCIHNVHDGIKILGDVSSLNLDGRYAQVIIYKNFKGHEHFKTPIYVVASRASKAAIDAIERNGGKVVCKYYNALALRDCVQGRSDRISAAPTRREDIGKLYIPDSRVSSLSTSLISSLVWET